MEEKNKKIVGIIATVLVIVLSIFSLYRGNKEKPKKINEIEIRKDEQNSIVGKKFPEFKLNNLKGREITDKVFNDYELTIVLMWQSTCSPCILELEALNEIHKEYKDSGVNVLGIVIDGEVNETVAKKVVDTIEIEFNNIVPDEDYIYKLIEFAQSTPTAFFIGNKGNFLMKPKEGTSGIDKDIEEFEAIIEKLTSSRD